MRLVDRIEARLTPALAAVYRRCAQGPPRTLDSLESAAGRYLGELRGRAIDEEFLDLATATRVAGVCMTLLQRLRESPDASHHRAVQAAVEFFLLEEDAEEDGSIVGFDDDLQVVLVTAEVLGWSITLADA